MKKTLLLVVCLVTAAQVAGARKAPDEKSLVPRGFKIEPGTNVSDRATYPVPRAAAQNVTTYLAYYAFEDACGCACDTQGWTSVDLTGQPDYFHVTAFTAPPDECGPGTGQ